MPIYWKTPWRKVLDRQYIHTERLRVQLKGFEEAFEICRITLASPEDED